MAKTEEKTPKAEPKKQKHQEEEFSETLVRIFGYDIPGSKNIYSGLTRIKGISWSISNALCKHLQIPLTKKISELSKEDVKHIEESLKNLPVPDYLKNRRYDAETGKTVHLFSSDLDMKHEFDIKRLKEIKSYRGIRHALKQPTRGQRTRSHFRKKSQTAMRKKK